MKKYYLNKDIRLKFDKATEKYYAFSISSGDQFVLTKTGYYILDLIEKGKTSKEIINFIHNKEKIDLNICKKDTIFFLNKSQKIGIIAFNTEEMNNDKKSKK